MEGVGFARQDIATPLEPPFFFFPREGLGLELTVKAFPERVRGRGSAASSSFLSFGDGLARLLTRRAVAARDEGDQLARVVVAPLGEAILGRRYGRVGVLCGRREGF